MQKEYKTVYAGGEGEIIEKTVLIAFSSRPSSSVP